jgi:hypothetical protein
VELMFLVTVTVKFETLPYYIYSKTIKEKEKKKKKREKEEKK